jgi:dihydroneopterin aldolase
MDRIILRGIEAYAYGGVTDAERQIGQRYRVEIMMEADLSAAKMSDAIEDTIHYGEVHAAVIETLRARPFNLIEAAADRIARRILDGFPVQSVTVRLEKLLPPIDGVVASAAVEMTRRSAAGQPEDKEPRDHKGD